MIQQNEGNGANRLGKPVGRHIMLSASRAALFCLFLLDGFGVGVWAAHVPLVLQRFHADNQALSVILFGLVAGSLASMFLTGLALLKTSNSTTGQIAAVAYCAALFVLGWTTSFGIFLSVAILFGAARVRSM